MALKAAEKSFSPRVEQTFRRVVLRSRLDGETGGRGAGRARSRLRWRIGWRRPRRILEKRSGLIGNGITKARCSCSSQVDATAPNQAVSYNLRGKFYWRWARRTKRKRPCATRSWPIRSFLRRATTSRRFLSRSATIEGARKQLEELLGATSGGRQERTREQLIRYEIFLTLLLEGRDGPAQKAMDEFKMMDDTPALYYAQAAWAFQHGNATQASIWVANAGNLYPQDLNRAFVEPLADLGWLSQSGAPSLAKQAPEPEQQTSLLKTAAVSGRRVARCSSVPLSRTQCDRGHAFGRNSRDRR